MFDNSNIVSDAIWHTALASQEELQDVIALLSIKSGPQGHHLPGKKDLLLKNEQTRNVQIKQI